MKTPITQQIAAVRLAIASLEKSNALLVQHNRMEQSDADARKADLESVLDSLMFLDLNTDIIQLAINAAMDANLLWFDCPEYPACGAPAGTICPGCKGKTRSLSDVLPTSERELSEEKGSSSQRSETERLSARDLSQEKGSRE